MKLYSEIAKHVKVIVVANKISNRQIRKNETTNIVLHRTWTRGKTLSLLRIFKEMVRTKADIFHLQHGWLLYGGALTTLFFPFLVLSLRLNQKPVLVTMHTIIKRKAKFSKNKILNFAINIGIFTITKLIVLFALKVIVHNKLMKRTLEENYGCKGCKIFVIPHGIEKVAEKNNCYQKGTPKENREITIVSLGFLRKSKGYEYLIEAFDKLQLHYPNLKLILIGGLHPHDNGEYAQRIVELVKNLKGQNNLVLTNFISENMLTEILQEASIIVLLSQETNFVEASGALARVADFNKPVICSEVPKFLSELTNGYNCIMVYPKSSTEIYNAINTLLEKTKLRKSIASNLKKLTKGRYWNCIAKKHLELYQFL